MKIKISYIKENKEVSWLAYNYDVEHEQPEVVLRIENKYSDDPSDFDNEFNVLIDLYKSTNDEKLKEAIKFRFLMLTGEDIEDYIDL